MRNFLIFLPIWNVELFQLVFKYTLSTSEEALSIYYILKFREIITICLWVVYKICMNKYTLWGKNRFSLVNFVLYRCRWLHSIRILNIFNYTLLFSLYSREISGLYVISSYLDYRFTIFFCFKEPRLLSNYKYDFNNFIIYEYTANICLMNMKKHSEHAMFIFHLL